MQNRAKRMADGLTRTIQSFIAARTGGIGRCRSQIAQSNMEALATDRYSEGSLSIIGRNDFLVAIISGVMTASPGESFALKNPSANWHSLTLAGGRIVWVWYKPTHLPQGLVFEIPDDTFGAALAPGLLTMRVLLVAAGVHPASVAVVQMYGQVIDGQTGNSPVFDQPIVRPNSDSSRSINVFIRPDLAHMPPPAVGQATPAWPTPVQPVPVQPVMVQPVTIQAVPIQPVPAQSVPVQSQPAPAAATPATGDLFTRIDADWSAIVLMEKQLVAIRKQMSSMLTRLNSLNRDLSPDERVSSDRADRNEWQDARRWLRDVASKVSRYIKEYDVGITSSAGKRDWYEDIHRQYIKTRTSFDGLESAFREFETYRKSVHQLHTNMSAAHANASQDGERRAQRILTKIAAKVRDQRAKRGTR